MSSEAAPRLRTLQRHLGSLEVGVGVPGPACLGRRSREPGATELTSGRAGPAFHASADPLWAGGAWEGRCLVGADGGQVRAAYKPYFSVPTPQPHRADQ